LGEDGTRLKTMTTRSSIRQRFLLAFERAEKATTEAERTALPDLRRDWRRVPTGVGCRNDAPHCAPHLARGIPACGHEQIARVAVRGRPRLLPTFHENLSERARSDLTELGVEVRTGAIVTRLERGAVWVGEERIESDSVFWAAGNEASPLGKFLGAPQDKFGRVKVEPDLSVPGHPEIFVVGDQAEMHSEGKRVPGVAQGAIQSGPWAAKNVVRRINRRSTVAFKYWNKGDTATIGRHRAVFQFPFFDIRREARVVVLVTAAHHVSRRFPKSGLACCSSGRMAYFTYQRGARLITAKGR